VDGKVWNVNSRTVSKEGVEALSKMFAAEGYSDFAPAMVGVVKVSQKRFSHLSSYDLASGVCRIVERKFDVC